MTTFAPPPDSALAPIETALLALLTAVEALPAEPATAADRAAMRRNGLEASQAGRSEAMDPPAASVDAAPEQSVARERLIDEAWAGLPGWRS